MSIGVMRCNKENCNGFVLYEDADYDLKDAINNNDWIVDDTLECEKCGRKFKAVPTWMIIHEDDDTGEFEILEDACITEYEKSK